MEYMNRGYVKQCPTCFAWYNDNERHACTVRGVEKMEHMNHHDPMIDALWDESIAVLVSIQIGCVDQPVMDVQALTQECRFAGSDVFEILMDEEMEKMKCKGLYGRYV